MIYPLGAMGVLDDCVYVGNLAASVKDGLLGVLDRGVGRGLVLKPNDDRLLRLDGESARENGERRGEKGDGLHGGRGCGQRRCL